MLVVNKRLCWQLLWQRSLAVSKNLRIGQINITEFKYKYNLNEAVVLCSVGVHIVSELRAMQERMESSQLKTYNLTESDMVKNHLCYLVCWPQNPS
ncbi:Threonine dehydratase biosynthetic, chloroplastic [Glycine soja]|uniref:Threonine dehydratase biosynthetic, chloroplastic n=1 Tax=Glycine soja TaxID=3848 RepID=A0A0B2S6A1_GLYSO|nr:Threonine dehydratase biosynthetic, chloroplastic [Glycine soja]